MRKEIEATLVLRNNRLKKQRLESGLSQFAMAQAIGISITHYADAEKLCAIPRMVMERIASFFRKDVDYFFPASLALVKQHTFVREIESTELRLKYEERVRAEIEYKNRLPPEQNLLQKELREAVEQSVAKLPRVYGKIISMRFGLNGYGAMTLREIGKELGLSVTRVQQIEAKAIRNLRYPARSRALYGYLPGKEPAWT